MWRGAKICFFLLFVLTNLFVEWFSRGVFLVYVYPGKHQHGKTYLRALRHYKKNWNLLQRLTWFFLFKEKYNKKTMWFAYLSYLHYITSFLNLFFFLGPLNFKYESFQTWLMCAGMGMILIRFTYLSKVED